MSAYSDDDSASGSRSQWERVFWKNYQELEIYINKLPSSDSRQLVPQTQATSALRQTEKKLKHVARKLETKEQALQDIWVTPVITVETTYQSEYGGETTESYDISLSDLTSWTQKPVIVEKQKTGRAAGVEQQNVAGYLPPIAANKLHSQIEHAIERIGWTPEVGTQDYAADEDEVMRHE